MDKQGFFDILKADGKPGQVSIPKLQQELQLITGQDKKTVGQIKQEYGHLDPVIRTKLQKISQFMQAQQWTVKFMHDALDTNKDGHVDREEFVIGLQKLNIPGLISKDFASIFECIDIDGNGYLSVHEFGLFVEGAKLSAEQRINQMPAHIVEEIKKDIQDLFAAFDENRDGKIDADEICKTMTAFGTPTDLVQAQAMIASVDANGNGCLDYPEFEQLMRPKIMEMLLTSEDNVEATRALFLEADIDYSGYLTADEVWNVLIKQGVDIDFEDLVLLMNEFDMDGDQGLDIDEFVAMMNLGEEATFVEEKARDTFLKVRKANKLSVMDFIKAFGSLPASMIPSTFTAQWKKNKNTPSSVLKPQIDLQTMMWKDMYPIYSDQYQDRAKGNLQFFKPAYRPLETTLGFEITLEGAAGIICPGREHHFDRNSIVKRVVRIGVFDTKNKEYIGNMAQIPILEGNKGWIEKEADRWNFNKKGDVGLNPVLFRHTEEWNPVEEDLSLIFEFVVYLKKHDSVKNRTQVDETSCGWAELKLAQAKKDLTGHELEVHGGSSLADIKIRKEDLDAAGKRSGLTGLLGIKGASKSYLKVSTKKEASLEEHERTHLNLMPSLCLVHKRLLHFVSGFRSYAGQILLKDVGLGQVRQPGGNIAIASFPHMIDNPDIIE